MPKPGKNKRMKVVEENIYNKIGETGYIDDGMGVHLVENCSPSEVCVTLHLYWALGSKIGVSHFWERRV